MISITAFACLAFCQATFSQLHFRPKTFRASFYNEATTLPTMHLVRLPIHPCITLGTDLWLKSGEHWHRSAGADLSFYHHRLNENAVMLDAIYNIGYAFGFGLQPKLIAAIGYKHAFAPSESYTFKNGEYQQETNWGTSHVNLKLGFGLEYPLTEKFCITSDYKFMVDAPYSESIPFSTHTFIGVGLKMKIDKKQVQKASQSK